MIDQVRSKHTDFRIMSNWFKFSQLEYEWTGRGELSSLYKPIISLLEDHFTCYANHEPVILAAIQQLLAFIFLCFLQNHMVSGKSISSLASNKKNYNYFFKVVCHFLHRLNAFFLFKNHSTSPQNPLTTPLLRRVMSSTLD